MFGKKYDPEQIVSHLTTILLPSCAGYVHDYLNAVRLDEAELTRMTFSMYLFSVAACDGGIQTTTNAKFKAALLKAHSSFLDRFPDRETLVNLGEIVIWQFERDFIARELHDRLGKSILPGDFDFHEIRYGTLLRIASDIRKNAFSTDIHLGVSQGQGDPKLGMQLAFKALGTSFTRYVLKIDPTDPELSSTDRDRFQRSVAHAIPFLGQGFFNVTDFLKTMGA
jgi:hypothetical protein